MSHAEPIARRCLHTAIQIGGLAVLAAVAIGGSAEAEGAEPDAVQVHIDRAFDLAGSDYFRRTAELQCGTGDAAMAFVRDTSPIPPTRVFDNVVYLGTTSVGAYALLTDAGIILIDALNSTDEIRTVIEPGLRQFGLDPATIRYVVITQAHGDHYGGARYLAEAYGARIMMSAADWDLLENPPRQFADRSRFGIPPKRDLVLEDGQQITLGGATVTVILTPGHSPATASLLFPVFDKGRRHVAGMWGGTGIPRDPAAIRQYVASAGKFLRASEQLQADVELNTHAFVNDSLRRMKLVRERPDQPNPFVIGAASYARYTKILESCAQAALARSDAAGKSTPDR